MVYAILASPSHIFRRYKFCHSSTNFASDFLWGKQVSFCFGYLRLKSCLMRSWYLNFCFGGFLSDFFSSTFWLLFDWSYCGSAYTCSLFRDHVRVLWIASLAPSLTHPNQSFWSQRDLVGDCIFVKTTSVVTCLTQTNSEATLVHKSVCNAHLLINTNEMLSVDGSWSEGFSLGVLFYDCFLLLFFLFSDLS